MLHSNNLYIACDLCLVIKVSVESCMRTILLFVCLYHIYRDKYYARANERNRTKNRSLCQGTVNLKCSDAIYYAHFLTHAARTRKIYSLVLTSSGRMPIVLGTFAYSSRNFLGLSYFIDAQEAII